MNVQLVYKPNLLPEHKPHELILARISWGTLVTQIMDNQTH